MPAITVESMKPPAESVVTMVYPLLGIPEYGFRKLSTVKESCVPPATSLKIGFVTVKFYDVES